MSRFVTGDGWSVEVVSYAGRGQRYLVRHGPYCRAETGSITEVRRALGPARFGELHQAGTRVEVRYRRVREPEVICCESPAEAQAALEAVLADPHVAQARILPD